MRRAVVAVAVLTVFGLLAPVAAVPVGAQTPPPLVDYDVDDDGLIEIASLSQLNAIRWDLDGDGTADVYPPARDGYTGHDPDGAAKLAAAFPNAAPGMGCPAAGCDGYELAADLDFDTNGNGSADAGDEFWNGGKGWNPLMGGEPIYSEIENQRFDGRWGQISLRLQPHGRARVFTGVFEGNGRTIANLYINRPRRWYVGLFGHIANGHVRNVGLSAPNADSKVWGDEHVGPLAGDAGHAHVSGAWSDIDVVANYAAGGLIGSSYYSVLSESYAVGDVTARQTHVGGLVGILHASTAAAVYATGDVAGFNSVGGLVGTGVPRPSNAVTAAYATGSVTFRGWAPYSSYAGGLFGRMDRKWVPRLLETRRWSSANYSTGQVSAVARSGGLSGSCGRWGPLGRWSASRARDLGYWDTEASGRTNGRGCGVGYTTAELQAPTGYAGIYATWNVDVDGDGSADDPWDFGTSSEYPVLKYCADKPGIDTADGLPYCALPDGVPPVPDPEPDPPPALVLPVASVAGDGSVGEGSFAVFTVTVAPPPSGGLLVQVTVRSSDFGVLSQTRVVRVPVSGSAKVYVATAVDYDSVDGWVTVSVDDDPEDTAAYAVSATQGAATVTVLDDG